MTIFHMLFWRKVKVDLNNFKHQNCKMFGEIIRKLILLLYKDPLLVKQVQMGLKAAGDSKIPVAELNQQMLMLTCQVIREEFKLWLKS